MSTCSSCQTEVVFVPSATTGSPMILDARPRKGVVMIQTERPEGGLVNVVDSPPFLSKARVVDVYTDHHVTCEKAAEWKGRTR